MAHLHTYGGSRTFQLKDGTLIIIAIIHSPAEYHNVTLFDAWEKAFIKNHTSKTSSNNTYKNCTLARDKVIKNYPGKEHDWFIDVIPKNQIQHIRS